MPLFVITNPQETQVGLDLAHIVGTDSGGIGTPGTGGTQDQVTYAQTQNSFSKNRMNTLINNTPSFPIVITGVLNTFTLPNGTPITSAAGVTSTRAVDRNAAGTGLNPNSTISIIYDVTGCGGAGYCGFDTSNNSIPITTEVILFHELAHAFHWTINDFGLRGGAFDQTFVEPQAETDENQLRAEEVPPLPARDINNHGGGCGTCVVPSKCFIVSAAFGSSQAPEVEAFRQLRDKLLRQSMLGDEFFAHLFAEYYGFSPLIAVDMNASDTLRTLIAHLLVEPLLAFLNLAEQYVLHGGWHEPGFADTVIDSLSGSLMRLAEVGKGQWHVSEVSNRLVQLRAGQHKDHFETRMRDRLVLFSTGDISSLFEYLDYVVNVGNLPTTYVDWALLTPLVLYWTALDQLDTESSRGVPIGFQFAQTIEDWLVGIPIPHSLNYSDEEVLHDELILLAQTAFAVPSTRQRFGPRLHAAFEGAVSYDLYAALQAANYL